MNHVSHWTYTTITVAKTSNSEKRSRERTSKNSMSSEKVSIDSRRTSAQERHQTRGRGRVRLEIEALTTIYEVKWNIYPRNSTNYLNSEGLLDDTFPSRLRLPTKMTSRSACIACRISWTDYDFVLRAMVSKAPEDLIGTFAVYVTKVTMGTTRSPQHGSLRRRHRCFRESTKHPDDNLRRSWEIGML